MNFHAIHSDWLAQSAGLILGDLILWQILDIGTYGVSAFVTEEIWSRNLGHLFVSPVREFEILTAIALIGIFRTFVGILPGVLLCIYFYSYSIFSLGLYLFRFYSILLVTGWAYGLVLASLVIRFGLVAEDVGFGLVMLLFPVSGVYYPISSLPEWLQPMSLVLPSAYVFEGMRSILIGGSFPEESFLYAIICSLVWIFWEFWRFNVRYCSLAEKVAF